jgi:hypothetical protein
MILVKTLSYLTNIGPGNDADSPSDLGAFNCRSGLCEHIALRTSSIVLQAVTMQEVCLDGD